MNHPLIANLNGNERHKSLIIEAENHRREKAISRGRGKRVTTPKFLEALAFPVNRVLGKTAVE
jgi:hypothetical protein